MIGIISLSKQGNALSTKIAGLLENTTCYTLAKWKQPHFTPIEGTLTDFCGDAFRKHDSLIFIMACGIVVRSIAPWIKNKSTDPAIVVIDDNGTNVISLLSGHLGGANALTIDIANKIAAHPVITTASDINHLPSVDMMAKSKNLVIDSLNDAKIITAMIVNRENVELVDNYGFFSNTLIPVTEGQSVGKIIVSNKCKINEPIPFAKLIPQNIVLGIGCRKGIAPANLFDFINNTLERYNLDKRSIKTIASITLKENEAAIIEAREKLNCQLQFFRTETLRKVDNLFEGSAFVHSTVGVASVSTTAAYIAGKKSGSFIVKKEIHEGMTLSIFEQKI